MIGKTVSHYEIVEKIGKGGMGVVYRARDTRLDRFVALKFLTVQGDGAIANHRRFQREARTIAALNHHNIVTIHEIDEVAGRQFMSMEYLEGSSLSQLIRDREANGDPFSLEFFLDIILQICDGLGHAHREGVIHRDIKPQNIMVNKSRRIKILDFGLALLKGSSRLTEKYYNVGTIRNMSPEQIKNETVDHRTDIWSLGTVMYELAAGRSPFSGDNDVAVIHSILNDRVQPLVLPDPAVSMDLSDIILKCLSRNPGDRYQSIDELAGDLNALTVKTRKIHPYGSRIMGPIRRFALVAWTVVILVFWIFFIYQKISRNKSLHQDTVSGKISHGRGRYTESADAYAFYLKGREHWSKRTPEDLFRGIEFYKKAIDKDENFALAYVGLADSYHLLASYSVIPPAEAFPKAKDAATRALVIDNTLGEAINSVAAVLMLYEWDWEMARKGFEKSLALNPDFPPTHEWYAIYQTVIGHLDEGVKEMQRAVQLDPLSNSARAGVARHLYYAGKFKDAIQQFEKALELDPQSFYALSMMGVTHAWTGNYPDALRCLTEAREITGSREPGILAGLGYTFARSGKRDEAVKILNRLEEMSRTRYVPSFYLASVHVGLGNTDMAFEWLEKAYRNRSEWMVFLKVEHILTPLRNDPRFSSLVKRVGLPDLE